MSAFDLDFLHELSAEEVVAPQPKTVKKDRNPANDFMGIRVWKDGSVYPSKALVDQFNLEYQKPASSQEPVMKDGQPVLDDAGKQVTELKLDFSNDNSYGIDIVDSNDWGQVAKTWKGRRLVLAGITFKRAGKVDLFAACRYDAGVPIVSVLDQGSSTYGKAQLLPMMGEVYGVQCGEGGYMDLELVQSHNLKAIAANGIFNLPKTIVRGTKAGSPDIARRENINIFPLIPVMETTAPLGTVDTSLPEQTQSPAPETVSNGVQAEA